MSLNSNNNHDNQPPVRAIVNAVCQFIGRAIKVSGIPGVHVGLNIRGQSFVLHDGECCSIRQCRTCGSATFPIGCLAKPLIAIAGLRLADLGTLLMDAPLTTYLPELGGYDKNITCTHLLTHTAGFKGTLSRDILIPGWNLKDLIEFLRKTPQLFSPGTVFNYEHLSLGLMCEIVPRASGKTCTALVDEVINGLAGTARRRRDVSANGFEGNTSLDAHNECRDIGLAWARSIHVDELLAVSEALVANRRSGTAEDSVVSDCARKTIFDPSVSIPKPLFGASKDHLPIGFSPALAMFCRGLVGYDGSLGSQAVAP